MFIQKCFYTLHTAANCQIAFKSQVHQGKAFCAEYEKSKFLADRIALQAAAEGVPITIVYPGVMYGPGTLTSGNLVCRVVRDLSFVTVQKHS